MIPFQLTINRRRAMATKERRCYLLILTEAPESDGWEQRQRLSTLRVHVASYMVTLCRKLSFLSLFFFFCDIEGMKEGMTPPPLFLLLSSFLSCSISLRPVTVTFPSLHSFLVLSSRRFRGEVVGTPSYESAGLRLIPGLVYPPFRAGR